MTMTQGVVDVSPDLSCQQRGCSPEKTRLVSLNRKTGVAVFKTSGGTYWSAIARRNYAPARFSVCVIEVMPPKSGETIALKVVRVLVEFEVASKHWPTTLAKLGP
jgi:hypothetical protein